MENKSIEQHQQVAAVINSLSAIRQKIARMNGMFPHYCNTLEDEYKTIIGLARTKALMPPWMG